MGGQSPPYSFIRRIEVQVNEMLRAFRAAELLYKNVDVSKMSKEDLRKDMIGTFCIGIDDKLKDFLSLLNSFIVRVDGLYSQNTDKELKKNKTAIDMSLSYDNFIDVLRFLKAAGIDSYVSLDEELFDPDFEKKMKDIEASHDYTKTYNCALKDLNPLDELKVLLALCQYPKDLGQKIYDYASKPQEFYLKDFKDFEVVNNRIIIPLSDVDKYKIKKLLKANGFSEGLEEVLSMNALVISKNPVDYFYCSYGNAFQSCFSLNSSMSCWYGYVPFVMADESYIIYGTTGEVMKTGIIRGKKFHSPQMLWRAWGYADKDGHLLVDKKYRKADSKYNYLIKACCEFLSSKFNCICDGPNRGDEERTLYNGGKGLFNIWSEYGLKFYADSLRRKTSKVYFYYGCGCNEDTKYTPDWKNNFGTFIDWAQSVTSVGSIDLSKKNIVNDGVLFTPKACPITSLPIDESMDKHPYAKYFTKPVQSLAVLTYINGTVFTDYTTEEGGNERLDYLKICTRSSITRTFYQGTLWAGPYNTNGNANRLISLKSLKELLKGNVKSFGYDAIFLRAIENDKVTCQVFRGN